MLTVQLTKKKIGFDNGLTPNRWQAIIWTNADPIRWHIYALLRGDELNGTRNTDCRHIVSLSPLLAPKVVITTTWHPIGAWWRKYESVNRVIIVSGNGLLPVRRQSITWTNTDVLLSIVGLLVETKFPEIYQNTVITKCIWKCLRRHGDHFVLDLTYFFSN